MGEVFEAGLAASLNHIGVLTSPFVAEPAIVAPQNIDNDPDESSTVTADFTQLQKDIQALQTELQTLSGTSGVTIADVTSLTSDTEAIAQGGVRLDPQALEKVASELATAVAGGTDTSQAKTDFNALFTGSSLAQATIDKAFTDMVQTITDSKVTTTDLNTVAADNAAIQTDLTKLTADVGPPDPGEVPLVTIANPPAVGFGIGGPGGNLGEFHGGLGAFSVSLADSLNEVGVVTHPVIADAPPMLGGPLPMPAIAQPIGPGFPITIGQNPAFQQLQKDQQTLQTELQSLAAKSGVTVADLTRLANDDQTIAAAGGDLNHQSPQTVTTELATAVAGGTDTSQAKTDFTALFKGSSVAQSAIDKSFTDMVQTITDSKVTTADLQTVAADQKAVQTDLQNLFGSATGANNGDGDSDDTNTGTGTVTGTGEGGHTGSGSPTTGGTTVKPVPLPLPSPPVSVGPQSPNGSTSKTPVSPPSSTGTTTTTTNHGATHRSPHTVTHHTLVHHAIVHKTANAHGKHR
jgi:cell division protein FtsB